MLLLNVCTAWADIALSTPNIWTAIKITFPVTGNFEDGLRMWLQRARDLPLSISLVGPAFDQDVMGIIWEHGQQLKHIEMCYKWAEDGENDDEFQKRIDFLESQSPGPLPLLETLTIRGLSSLYHGQGYWGSQFLELLGLAPNLAECIFDGIQPVLDLAMTVEKLVLPVLRRLSFGGGYETRPNSDDRIITCLTLPALEVLSLPLRNCSDDDLFAFLKRSSPPLKQLVMGKVSSGGNSLRLQECLHLVPTLTDLIVWNPGSRLMTELSAALADSSSLLPNLHTLRICAIDHSGDFTFDPGLFWEALVRALFVRRTQIRIVHIDLSTSVFPVFLTPSTSALDALRERVVEGMEIYVGNQGENSNFVPSNV
ncbi:hypothetical protein B0H19DRAFT_1261733 [Mycena capillaripes]|nr:hypothetical protein B0H19DRAFT_1261733 [Mycena capillaripes]